MNKRMQRIDFVSVFVVVVAFVAAGCSTNSNEPEGDNLTPITLTEELTISADHEAALIGNFSGLAVGDDETIYAADTKLQKVHVFSPQGAYLDSIGRQGKGPGEFQDLDPDISVQSDTLYVLQQNPRRIELFNRQSREIIRTITIPATTINDSPIGGPRNIFPQRDGSIFIRFLNPFYNMPDEFGVEEESLDKKFNTISLLSSEGKFINKNVVQTPTLYPSEQTVVHVQPRSIYIFNTSFYQTLQVASDHRGHIYLGVSDSLLLRKYDQTGAFKRVIKANYQPPVFTDTDLDSLGREKRDGFFDAVEEIGVPEHWPAFQKILIDDEGRSWVQLMNPGSEQQRWNVFDAQGNPQWKFSLPTEVELFAVQQGKAYGIFSSEESLPEIRRYSIEI